MSTRAAPAGQTAAAEGRPYLSVKWRQAVHKRSGFRCQGPGCGLSQAEIEAYGGELQAAHIWPWHDCAAPLPEGVLGGPTLDEHGRPLSARFDPRNGLSACTFKNRRHPAGIGNGYGCHAVIDRWGSKVPPGVSELPERGTAGSLLGTPLVGMYTLPWVVIVWLLQGFGVFSFFITPIWILFAVAIGGIPSGRFFAWWVLSMAPADIIGIYLARYAHRTRLPSRALRRLWAWAWIWAKHGGRKLRGAWHRARHTLPKDDRL